MIRQLFILIGKSGSGKTTLAQKIVNENPDIEYFSLGDEFRKIAQKNKEIANYVFAGERVPEAIAFDVMSEVINNFSKKYILLDGFPRDINQAKILKSLIDKNNLTIKNVFEIDVTDDVAQNRVLQRGRDYSDNLIVFNSRLEDYKYQIKLIREYYADIFISSPNITSLEIHSIITL